MFSDCEEDLPEDDSGEVFPDCEDDLLIIVSSSNAKIMSPLIGSIIAFCRIPTSSVHILPPVGPNTPSSLTQVSEISLFEVLVFLKLRPPTENGKRQRKIAFGVIQLE